MVLGTVWYCLRQSSHQGEGKSDGEFDSARILELRIEVDPKARQDMESFLAM